MIEGSAPPRPGGGLIAAARLVLRPRPLEQFVGERPHYIVKREGEQWGVAVLHGGKQVDFMTPKETRRLANKLIDLGYLASNPGQLPQESCG